MPITVPKPITSPSPMSVTHTPYDPSIAAFNANIQPFTGQQQTKPLPVGTITGMYPNISSLMKQFAPKAAAPPSTMYKAPNPYLVNQMLQALKSGGSVDPKTGWYGSAAQAMGKAGGSLQSFLAHKGVLDPASAQYAVDQFKQGIASGQIAPGGGYGQWRGNQPQAQNFQALGAPNPYAPQTQNYFNAAFSQPGSMQVGSVKDIGQVTGAAGAPTTPPVSSAVQDALNQLANQLVGGSGGDLSNAAKQQLAQNMTQPGIQNAFAQAMQLAQAQKAANDGSLKAQFNALAAQQGVPAPSAPMPVTPLNAQQTADAAASYAATSKDWWKKK